MSHEIDGQDQTPHVGESHDQRFDGGEVEAVLDGNVNQAHRRTAEDDQLIAGVGADRIDETAFGFTVSGIDVLAQQREDGPAKRNVWLAHCNSATTDFDWHIEGETNQVRTKINQ